MQQKIGDTVVEFDGKLPQVGEKAPDFRYVDQDFKVAQLSDHQGEVVVLLSMLSVDTGTCAMESRTFNKHMSELGATTLLVTLDLPWGMKNFCSSEGIDKCIPASDFRFREFSQGYHLVMQNGPLAGILARMVLVVDKEGVIRYTELVPVIGDEPNYDAALAAVKDLL